MHGNSQGQSWPDQPLQPQTSRGFHAPPARVGGGFSALSGGRTDRDGSAGGAGGNHDARPRASTPRPLPSAHSSRGSPAQQSFTPKILQRPHNQGSIATYSSHARPDGANFNAGQAAVLQLEESDDYYDEGGEKRSNDRHSDGSYSGSDVAGQEDEYLGFGGQGGHAVEQGLRTERSRNRVAAMRCPANIRRSVAALKNAAIYAGIAVIIVLLLLWSAHWVRDAPELYNLFPWAAVDPVDTMSNGGPVKINADQANLHSREGRVLTGIDSSHGGGGGRLAIARLYFSMRVGTSSAASIATPMVGILEGLSDLQSIVTIVAICADTTGRLLPIPIGPRPPPAVTQASGGGGGDGVILVGDIPTEFIVQLSTHESNGGANGGVVTVREGTDLPASGAPWLCSVVANYQPQPTITR
jgi:hypothetical protein